MQKIVYILGSTRTGSTMLDMILGSHPECASLGEICLAHKRNCGFCGMNCKWWIKYWKIYAKRVGCYLRVSNIFRYEETFEAFNADILIDSSKKWKWLKERMKYEKYDYKIIHLIRNGKDRLKTKKRLCGKIEPKIVQAWVNTHRECEKIRKKHGGILVKYEEIKQEIPRICDFIGIDYQPQMLEFWKHEHHGLPGSKTAFALMRNYHNIVTKHDDFIKSHGFNLKPRLGHEFLDEKDLKIFDRCGGNKLNERLGYE